MSSWDAPTSQPLAIEQMTTDQLITAWKTYSNNLAIAKASELRCRNEILKREFATALEGTHNLELGKGWSLKAIIKQSYSLDKDHDKVQVAIDTISKIGNEGQFLADRLIDWKPELKIGEYKKLAPQYKTILDKVLTIKPGQGTIELVPPKEGV